MADSGTPRRGLITPLALNLFHGSSEETDEEMITEAPMEVVVRDSAEQQQTMCDDALQLDQLCIVLEHLSDTLQEFKWFSRETTMS